LTVEGAGQCSIVLPCTDERTWESSIIRVRLNTQEADPSFYFYYFRSAHGRQRIETIVEQVAAAGIRNSDLRLLLVPLPPLSEQRAIAEVLGALDDKIEANQNLCSIIGGLARAKVVAAQAVAEHAVPLGNLVRRVTDIARPDELEAGVVYVGLEHIPRGSLFLTEWGSAEGLASAKARFQPGDILFGKLRPYFKKVVIAPSAGVCSTDVLVLRPRHSEQSALTLIICSSDEVINYASSGSHGTRMPRVSWDYLSAWQCPMPDEDTVQTIQQLVEPMLQQAVHLTHESILLAQLRDALLPKLLSGELRVHNAESLVKAAV
jgi:type I restriction enzyme S subunit